MYYAAEALPYVAHLKFNFSTSNMGELDDKIKSDREEELSPKDLETRREQYLNLSSSV